MAPPSTFSPSNPAALIVVIVLFGVAFYFAGDIVQFLAQPLYKALPPGSRLITTDLAGAVFTGWQEAFTALFRRHRLPEDRSRRLAALVVAAEEGAVILCRAEQSTAPMEAVATEIHDLLVHALSTRPVLDLGDGENLHHPDWIAAVNAALD